jgi:hypothetical protein
VNARKLRIGQEVSMTDWNNLTPNQQRQALADQMQTSREYDWMVRSQTVEALARSRELLAVPVYHSPDIGAAAGDVTDGA